MGIFDSKQSTTVDPYKASKPYLDDSIARLGGLDVPEFYSGALTAGMTPGLQNALQAGYGFGAPGGTGDMSANALMGAGMGALGGYGQAGNLLSRMGDAGAPQYQFDQGTYDQVMGNLSGPGMQNAFDLGANQINQSHDWNVLPGLNMGAAMAGGGGGTKLGQSGALADAMRAQNVQQFGSNMWQNAANQATGAGISAGSQNLASEQNQLNRMLGGYMGLGGAGANLMQQGYGQGVNNIGMGMDTGQFELGYDQSALDRNVDRHMYNQNAPWQYEQQRLNSLMAPSQAFSTQTSTSSPGIGNLALQAGAAYLTGGGSPAAGGLNPMMGGGGGYNPFPTGPMGGMTPQYNQKNPFGTDWSQYGG